MRTIKMKRGIIAFLLFSGLTSQVFGVDLYWRSKAVSNNFNDAINWVTDPAEIDSDNPGSTPALIPGQNDDVHFTVASTYQTLVATGNKADVHSIYCSAPADYVLRNTNLNIYGSISSNGKFSLNGGNTSCVGSDPATIDLGTDDRLSFGGMFTINKTAATKIELVNRGLNISSGFVFAEGQFNSNGYDIAATLARFSALTDTRTVDLAGSTLTLFGENDNTTQIFENNLHPECDLIIYNLGSEIRGNVTFRSITFANPRYHTSRSSAMTYFTAEDFIVNTPAINFTPTFGEQQRWCKITVTGKLEFLQPAGITIDSNRSARAYQYPDTLNINEIVFEPADCFERSALVSSFSVVLNATGNAIATQNITFRNVEFGGAGFTASASDDGGLNSGTVTWNPVTPKNYYWTGGAGMWDDPDHWTLDPAGNPAASNGCIPTATDNVFFKDFSFAASGQEVTLQVPATCNNITWDDPDREGILQSATSLTSLAITGNVDFSGAQAVYTDTLFTGKKRRELYPEFRK